jgi:hypothetical protein
MNPTKYFFTLTFTPPFRKEWKSGVTGAGFHTKTHRMMIPESEWCQQNAPFVKCMLAKLSKFKIFH